MRRRWVGEDLGQSLVEIALSLPMLTFLLLGGADMARGYAVQLAVQDGARAGAEAAAIDYSPTVAKAQARACDEMGRTPGMNVSTCPNNPNDPAVYVTFAQPGGAACTQPPAVTTPCYATVEVRYTFRTVTPWPLIPHTFTIDRTTTIRMFASPD
ncbi:MAG: pilus assembly protein [Chloroflexota bacterium]|nr:pilus assembly protein [Chloroflexota bacterium]MDE3103235.1 pilus assembly protein [Chloroflexota bacterium]